jgi:outer membrane protein OmpA-like peptidoglycan-associated protein
VVDHLLFQGVETERLLAKGYGPDKPIENNASEAGRATNRRVEFIILGAER